MHEQPGKGDGTAVALAPPVADAPARTRRPLLERLRAHVPLGFALAVLVAFVGYYAICCFRARWGGDLQLYCAAVAELYRDYLHPGHETMRAPGSQSTAYTVYLVALAGVGRLLGVTPFRALQLAGVVDVGAYAAAVAYFFSRASMHRRWYVPAALFVLVTLLLRWQNFFWSSETSLLTFRVVQAYPSTVGWALAFVVFGLVEDLLRDPRPRPPAKLGLLTLLFWLLLLTHLLTAGWVVGIVGVRGVFHALRRKDRVRPAWLAVALAVALALTTIWPYYAFFAQARLGGLIENARFGKHPFADEANLYLVAAPCVVWLALRARRHAFWMLGLVATLVALLGLRALGIDFASRYSFFMAFFAQFLVAEVAAVGFLGLLVPSRLADQPVPVGRGDRVATAAVLVASLAGGFFSPMWARAMKPGPDRLRSPLALLGDPSVHDAYYARLGGLRAQLGRGDLVLLPISRDAFDVASITGAKVVCPSNALRIADYDQRRRDVDGVFADAAGAEVARAVGRRYGANRLLVPAYLFKQLPRYTAAFGAPVYRDGQFALYTLP